MPDRLDSHLLSGGQAQPTRQERGSRAIRYETACARMTSINDSRIRSSVLGRDDVMALPRGARGPRRVPGRARRPQLECLEGRIALATNIAVLSATTVDSRSVDVSYRVDGDGGTPLELAIYRSADARFDASDP